MSSGVAFTKQMLPNISHLLRGNLLSHCDAIHEAKLWYLKQRKHCLISYTLSQIQRLKWFWACFYILLWLERWRPYIVLMKYIHWYQILGKLTVSISYFIRTWLTPAPEQVYLSGVNDGRNRVTYHNICLVNTKVSGDNSRFMIGYCFCYANPDWSKSYTILDLLRSNCASWIAS